MSQDTPKKIVVGFLCLVLIFSVVRSQKFSIFEHETNSEAAALLAAHSESCQGNCGHATSSEPQFVLLSFDGSKSIDMWRSTREFAQQMNAKGKPLHFTYFINSIYFLTKENAHLYKSPREKEGVSLIGYSESKEDIAQRIDQVSSAFKEGNEIGSHTAGHFNGSTWSFDEWHQEFLSFERLLFGAQANNPSVQMSTLSMSQSDIVGFRAPELGVNDNLYKVLAQFKFLYDASGVGSPHTQPHKDSYGIWHIPLSTIQIGESRSPAVAMDYSLWMHQSKGKNIAFKGTELWNQYFSDVKGAYLEYFNEVYKDGRAPVVIGHHFSLWNDGVYWEAMKAFAEEVCGMKDVRCVTFKEYVNYLNSKPEGSLAK